MLSSFLVIAASLCVAEPPQCTLPGWQAVVKESVTYRAPHGHTHTCPKCGTTWDHQANPTHKCQKCGSTQTVVDRTPRPVTVFHAAPQPVIQAAPVQTPIVFRSLKATGGCANGQCPYAR